MLGHNADPAVRAAWLEDMFLPPDVLEWALIAIIIAAVLAVLGGRAISAQDKYTVQVPGGLVASMEKIRQMIAAYKATLFINHDKKQTDKLKLLPEFYN